MLWPSSSISEIYKTGTLTDTKVYMWKVSLQNIIYNRKVEKSTGSSQMLGSRVRLRKSWKMHNGILCSGEKERGGPTLRHRNASEPHCWWKTKERILVITFMCINISKYTQKVNSSSCSRKKNLLASNEIFTVLYFLIMNYVNVQPQYYKNIYIINMF